jgi:hypothetical protein
LVGLRRSSPGADQVCTFVVIIACDWLVFGSGALRPTILAGLLILTSSSGANRLFDAPGLKSLADPGSVADPIETAGSGAVWEPGRPPCKRDPEEGDQTSSASGGVGVGPCNSSLAFRMTYSLPATVTISTCDVLW